MSSVSFHPPQTLLPAAKIEHSWMPAEHRGRRAHGGGCLRMGVIRSQGQVRFRAETRISAGSATHPFASSLLPSSRPERSGEPGPSRTPFGVVEAADAAFRPVRRGPGSVAPPGTTERRGLRPQGSRPRPSERRPVLCLAPRRPARTAGTAGPVERGAVTRGRCGGQGAKAPQHPDSDAG